LKRSGTNEGKTNIKEKKKVSIETKSYGVGGLR